MTMDANHNSPSNHDAIAGVLASALNMEDDISSGVYDDYLNRSYWPEQLDEGTFAEIRQRLTVLIEDTRKHKKIIEALVREHGKNE
jgi:hypothetical protein